MRKALTIKVSNKLYYYDKNIKRKEGKNDKMSGDCSGLNGNCSGLRGSCSYLSGDCSYLSGDCSGLEGNCSGLIGDLTDCEITNEDRYKGINIEDLVR